MANVSQKISTFLGGVSRKADFDKTEGQVIEANNIYPDETYGMVKRPGFEFIGSLGIDDAEASNTYFFPIIREGRPRYLCGLKSGSIKIWNLDDPSIPVTVNTPDGTAYLTYNNVNSIIESQAYRFASDDRRTVIVNRTFKCQQDTTQWSSAAKPFVWTNRTKNKDANSIEDLPDGRVLRIHVTGGGSDFPEDFRPLRPGTHYLPVTVMDEDNNGNPINTEGFGCVIKCTVNDQGKISADELDKCELWSAGSGYPDQCPASIDGIPGSRVTLATGMQPGEVYRVVNSASNLDDFYMQPFSNTSEADDDPGIVPGNRARIDGPYFWKECPSPDSYVGLSTSTLPHELKDNLDGSFTFRRVDYSNRWAGDNVNNPAPSFIDSYINNVFFLNNRLGFLCEDNVILSRPINYGPPGSQDIDYVPDDNPWVLRNYTEIDFFRQSAIGMSDADPIDMKAANNNVSIFHTVISTPQGTILFADGQQSLLFQPQGLLSPLTASLNSLSNYDMTDDVNAVIVGETYYFINKSERFCRIYSMINQGMQNPPIIEDVTAEVADWLPNDITDLVSCPTDSMIFAFNRQRDTLYCRRTIGELSSWTKWTHVSPIYHMVVDHDLLYFISNTNNTDTTISKARLYVLPDDYSLNQRNLLGDSEVEYSVAEQSTRTAPEYVDGCYKLSSGAEGCIVSSTCGVSIDDPEYPEYCNRGDTYGLSRGKVTEIVNIEAGEVTPDNNRLWTLTYKDLDGNIVVSDPFFDDEETTFSIYQTYSPNGSAEGNPDCVDPEPQPCCNLCIQKTDGKTIYTGISSNEWFVSNYRDDTIIHYKDCNEPTFDPYQYKYYRYVGQLSNPQNPVYNPGGYGQNIGTWIDTAGRIVTPWTMVEANKAPYVGGPTFPGYWGGAGYTYRPGWRLNEEEGQGPGEWVDLYDNTTTWTVERPWGARMQVTTTGFDGPGGQIFVGSMGLFIDGQQELCNPSADSGGAFPAPPFRMSMQNDPSESITTTISGYWEFSNDGSTVVNSWSTDTAAWKTYRIPTAEFESIGCCTPPQPILDSLILDPYLDHFTDDATVSGTTITPPAGFPRLENARPVYLIGNLPGATPVASDRAGETGELVWDGNNLVCGRDLTAYASSLIIGYPYDYELLLPTFYFNLGDNNYDYTASLTISRVKLAFGYSGPTDFDILIKNASTWEKAYSQIISNDYLASTAPLNEPTIVQVPIHKRTSDFKLQVRSDSPFPLSVDSCMWEGNYSPKYYRRF